MGRPERDTFRRAAMTELGNGLFNAEHDNDSLTVREAELAMLRRFGASEHDMLFVQANLASTYEQLGRVEEALRIRQEVYSGHLKLNGEEYIETIRAALNYAASLNNLKRFEEAKPVLLKTIPVVRRVIGDSDALALRVRIVYGIALYEDSAATLDDLREAAETLEEIERTGRRVLGSRNPVVVEIEKALRRSQAVLGAHEA